MKIFIAFIALLLLTGCSQKLPIQEKIVYRDKQCPTPRPKPDFIKYQALILEINGEEYYAFPKSEAIKLVTNWVSYREWAEANYELIKVEKPYNSSKKIKSPTPPKKPDTSNLDFKISLMHSKKN